MSVRRSAHELGPAIEGRRRRFRPAAIGNGSRQSAAGCSPEVESVVTYYVAEPCAQGRERCLLLVHDLRPTSSAYEMRPLFESFRWRRPTYAIDLPGFGMSDRHPLPYSPALFAAVLAELLRRLKAADAAVDVVALGRGAEAAARVASEQPGLIRSIAVLEPSGLLPARGGFFERLAARFALALGETSSRALFLRFLHRGRWSGARSAPASAVRPIRGSSGMPEKARAPPAPTVRPFSRSQVGRVALKPQRSTMPCAFQCSSCTTRAARTRSRWRRFFAVGPTVPRFVCRPRAECHNSSARPKLSRLWNASGNRSRAQRGTRPFAEMGQTLGPLRDTAPLALEVLMQPVVRVRDVARGQVYDCNPDEPILRGPYDLFRPDGPVQIMQDGLVKWWHAGAEQRARVVPGTLRDALAGQRVLMKLPATLEAEVWWVCEVEAAVGAEAPQASFGRRPAGAKDETR